MKDLSLSAKTIRGLHAMLRQCLDQAVQERLISYNPAAGCKLLPKKKEIRTLPVEKIGAYLNAEEEHGVLLMFYLELTTGLWRGELVTLMKSRLLGNRQADFTILNTFMGGAGAITSAFFMPIT